MTPTNLSRLAEWAKLPATSDLIDPTDPAADAREVDRVWLADVMHTLRENFHAPSVDWAQTVVARACCGKVGMRIDAYESSATLALLRAARAAGVPEVAEAMGDDSNG
jgi:hypothetical protein